MIWISYLGAPITVIGVGLVAALTFFWRRERYALLALFLALPGGMLLNVLMKDVIQRQRPTFTDPLLTLTSYSFPSGHALGSTLLYGVLAAIIVSTGSNRRLRVLTIAGASLLIVLVCVSRIYLGVHYLSDVVAGVLGGIAWLTLCLFAVTTFKRRGTGGRAR
jgi:undecaprenyl-diphosphatase